MIVPLLKNAALRILTLFFFFSICVSFWTFTFICCFGGGVIS